MRSDHVTRELEVEGLAFRVIHSPAPSASRTYVLVHGIGVSHRYLRRLHAQLALDAEVISVDLPGFGGLPKPSGNPDVAGMARGLAALLDQLDPRDVAVVGHSMGSQWVIELAAQRPDLVSHVVAMGPVADDRHRTPLAQARALAVDTLGESPAVNWLVFTDYLRCGMRWYSAQLRHMLTYPIEDRARSLTRPLLVLRGQRDPIAGLAWCRRLRDAARDALLVEIPRGRHVVQERAPRAVAAAIEAFVASRPSAGDAR